MTIWNPSIVAFSIGPLEVRWYSLCWCIGLALAYIVVYKLYKQQRLKLRNTLYGRKNL